MNADTILEALRKNVESDYTDASGEWATVYLANAKPEGCNSHQFAGFLSSLETQGLYRKCDGFFGEVKIL